jgi:hypothetical protein
MRCAEFQSSGLLGSKGFSAVFISLGPPHKTRCLDGFERRKPGETRKNVEKTVFHVEN